MAFSDKKPFRQAVRPTTTTTTRRRRTIISRLLPILLSLAFLHYVVQPLVGRQSYSLPYADWPEKRIPVKVLQDIILATPSEEKVSEWSRYYTSGAHLGGKNLSQALWTKKKFEEFGIAAEIVSYDIWTNYPVSHRLALLKVKEDSDEDRRLLPRKEKNGKEYDLVFEASLEEDVLEEDPTTGSDDRIPTFHGYSANGNVTAEYIFANYGSYRDYDDLTTHGVNLTNKIVICRYGKVFRGLKVKRAQELGAIGVLIYSDPGDDGNITIANGHEAYPNGPARNPSSVQRGSVQFLSMGAGDPTTPGWASKPDAPRVSPYHTVPQIPSLPISYKDALPILKALNGHGLNASTLGGDWTAGGLYYEGVEYNIGPAKGVVLNLVNEVDYVITPQWDVIGIINGSVADETVIMGNHRDAWVTGGAGDPNGGSAALIELARSFGKMIDIGWKPLRTIVLASWDGEEYGLLGSTEWVEDYAPWLRTSALAYINLDIATAGNIFSVASNPLLSGVINNATSLVPDPSSSSSGENQKSVYDVWSKRIKPLGSGSDYAAFQDFLGIPSTDMGFDRARDGPIWHYHSNYDSFHWMEKFGDPGFRYHTAVAKVWGLMVLQLAESPVVAFNATDYAASLIKYLSKIKTLSDKASTTTTTTTHNDDNNDDDDGSFKTYKAHLTHLEHSILHLFNLSISFDTRAQTLSEKLNTKIPWWGLWKRVKLWIQVSAVNKKYQYLDRAFIYSEGLDGRELFKHVVYAPGRWTGYAGATFPGLRESIEDGNWTNAAKWSTIIEKTVLNAAGELE